MANQPRQNFPNAGHFYSNMFKPIRLDLQFTVTPTNGLGVTSLKSNGYIQNVFMHTSTTPASNNGQTNPNPANGFAIIQLRNNFNAFLGSSFAIQGVSATSTKIDNSELTAGNVYIISVVGDATAAQWLAVGLPAGVTAAVGVAFVATAVGAGSNALTSRVQVPSATNIVAMDMINNPILTQNSAIYTNAGQYLIARFLAASAAAPTFTGSALTAHTHDLKIIGSQAAAGTDAVSAKTLTLGKESATDITVAGANSATLGGVVSASAGTPAGTISAPAMSLAAAAPTTGSVISMSLLFDGSAVTVDGI
jgi:hypothetical protein